MKTRARPVFSTVQARNAQRLSVAKRRVNAGRLRLALADRLARGDLRYGACHRLLARVPIAAVRRALALVEARP